MSVLTLVLLIASTATAAPTVQIINEEQGLPAPFARALAMTADGALWVALHTTSIREAKGVARIDSQGGITAFAGEKAGLRSDYVRTLRVAGDRLWAGTAKGLHRFEPSAGKFVAAGPEMWVEYLVPDGRGRVWALGGNRAHEIRWAAPLSAEGLSNTTIPTPWHRGATLLPRKDGKLWLVGEARLSLGDETGFAEVQIPLASGLIIPRNPEAEMQPPIIWIYDAAMAGDGSLFIVGFHKTLVQRTAAGAWITLASGHLSAIESLPDGSLLLADHDGNLSRLRGTEVTRLLSSTERKTVRILAVEQNGTAWLLDEGRTARIGQWQPPYNAQTTTWWDLSRNGSSSPGVLDTLADGKGGLWVSTNDGVWHLTP